MDDVAQDAVSSARDAGKAQAAAFDAALRQVEDRERTERLTRLAAGVENDPWPEEPGESAPTEVARLQRQVEALSQFRSAVLASRPWRAIQAVRRLFGRAW